MERKLCKKSPPSKNKKLEKTRKTKTWCLHGCNMYQRPKEVSQASRLLLGDEMGLGKTVTALALLRPGFERQRNMFGSKRWPTRGPQVWEHFSLDQKGLWGYCTCFFWAKWHFLFVWIFWRWGLPGHFFPKGLKSWGLASGTSGWGLVLWCFSSQLMIDEVMF